MNRIKKLAFKHALGKKEVPPQVFETRESTKKRDYKVVIVTNSKGGVGKSTVASAIALNIASKNQKIGILDADISSANLPSVLSIPEDTKVEVKPDGTIIPLSATPNLELYSIAALIDREKVVSIPESGHDLFLRDASEIVQWHTKRLIIDLPGGTNMFLLAKKHFNVLGAVIVTMPNQAEDTRRIIDLCLHNRVNILGICENLSGAVWDDGKYISNNGERFAPFGYDSMHGLCEDFGVEHLGNIPLFHNFSLDKVRQWKTATFISEKLEEILQ